MSDRSKLLALAEAVEKLTGPDRRTDCLIENELGLARFVEDRPAPFGGGWLDKRVEPKPFTASLDAAMTLVPEGMVMALTNAGTNNPLHPDFATATALVCDWRATSGQPVIAATMPISLTAAALRAQASQVEA